MPPPPPRLPIPPTMLTSTPPQIPPAPAPPTVRRKAIVGVDPGMTYVYAAVMDRDTASTPRFSLVSTKSYREDCGFAAAAQCAERKLATNLGGDGSHRSPPSR